MQNDFPPYLLEAIEDGAVVVSGSRAINRRDMPDTFRLAQGYALKIIERANEEHFAVIVGDAYGIDSLIIDTWAFKGLTPLIIMGCYAVGTLRLRVIPREAKKWLVPGGDRKGSCFIIRDEAMAHLASLAPQARFVGLWNGESNGTRKTAQFCREYQVPGKLFNLITREIAEEWGDPEESE